MEKEQTYTEFPFLSGGGEMGRLTREKDWSVTSVGDPSGWPQSLRTTISIILNSKFPMFLFWGPELVCFYNDAYRPSLGNDGKHPHILGGRAEDFWQEIMHIIRPLIDKVLSTGEGTWSEDQLIPIYRNGKIEDVYWTFSYSPVKDESGKPSGVFVTCSETTGKVIALKVLEESEMKLRALSNSLEHLVDERTTQLEEKNSDLEKINRELQSFAYISSHDLQEPLRKIRTFSTRIMEKEEANLSPEGKDNFQRMQNAARRMQTLIEDLLAYSRTNSSDRKFVYTDLNKIFNEVKEDLKEEFHNKNAILESNVLPALSVIPFQFRQLLYNLISNSLKFSDAKRTPKIVVNGEVAIAGIFNEPTLIHNKKYCHISVIDNGIGFEQQYSEKIFEVFQRLHGRSEFKGTGIGLAIVKKIVDNHHGLIKAHGKLDQGATFDVYIPTS